MSRRFLIRLILLPFKFLHRIRCRLYNKIMFFTNHVTCIDEHKINGKIYIYNRGEIKIGSGFRANSGKYANPIGGDTILRLICQKNAKITIGNNVGISNSTITCKNKIIIEDNVLIGGGCKIWDTDFHSLDADIRGTNEDGENARNAVITIKKQAFIGAGSVILKGVIIGKKSIVAAGSVVSKSIPSGEIWGGNPAKFIRKI